MSSEPNANPLIPRLRRAGLILTVVAIVVLVHGLVARASADSRLRSLTDAESVPTVAVVAPSRVDNLGGLELPGRLEAYIRAPIYARVPGYLKSWSHDIGSRVKAGDVLAQIDTPDLDSQLRQARADLSVAQANAQLAEITAKRWQALAGTDAVAKQDVDQRTFAWNASVAQVNAAQANVDRLVAEESFKRLKAPFDGIVTARDTDIGALINVGSAGGSELFVVSDTRKLRVYVNVPQNFVPSVPPGTIATLNVPERPGKTYSGRVEASAQAVTPSSGTTLMQIIVDNRAGELLPGGYASLHLQNIPADDVLSVPESALIFDSRGLHVATVDSNDRVHLKPVTIARDLGTAVELASGISADDRVIENPPDGIEDGTTVQILGASGLEMVGRTRPHTNSHG